MKEAEKKNHLGVLASFLYKAESVMENAVTSTESEDRQLRLDPTQETSKGSQPGDLSDKLQ